MKKYFIPCLLLLALMISPGCGTLKQIGPDWKNKHVTPIMEVQMNHFLDQGCDQEYEIYNKDLAFLYSVIPGGGHFYTGDYKRGFWFMFTSAFVLPYFASFEDAQRGVDYHNLKYTIDFCRQKLRLTQKLKERKKKPHPLK